MEEIDAQLANVHADLRALASEIDKVEREIQEMPDTKSFTRLRTLVAEYDGPEPFDSTMDAADMLTSFIEIIRPMVEDDSLTPVLFKWHSEWGTCYECGIPAAFWSPTCYGRPEHDEPTDDEKLCAVCAANQAAVGETIKRIVEDD